MGCHLSLPAAATPRGTGSAVLPGDDARPAFEIVADLNLLPPPEQWLDPVRDGSADLDDQPATGLQSGLRLRDEALDDFEARGSCENRAARLEFADLELHLVLLAVADVGRVRHDEVEVAGLEAFKQVALVETHAAFELMTGGIGAGHLERGRGNIGGGGLGLGGVARTR